MVPGAYLWLLSTFFIIYLMVCYQQCKVWCWFWWKDTNKYTHLIVFTDRLWLQFGGANCYIDCESVVNRFDFRAVWNRWWGVRTVLCIWKWTSMLRLVSVFEWCSTNACDCLVECTAADHHSWLRKYQIHKEFIQKGSSALWEISFFIVICNHAVVKSKWFCRIRYNWFGLFSFQQAYIGGFYMFLIFRRISDYQSLQIAWNEYARFSKRHINNFYMSNFVGGSFFYPVGVTFKG